jgi:hypothetical protein
MFARALHYLSNPIFTVFLSLFFPLPVNGQKWSEWPDCVSTAFNTIGPFPDSDRIGSFGSTPGHFKFRYLTVFIFILKHVLNSFININTIGPFSDRAFRPTPCHLILSSSFEFFKCM